MASRWWERHRAQVRVEEGERRGGGYVDVDGQPARGERPYRPVLSERPTGGKTAPRTCQDGL